MAIKFILRSTAFVTSAIRNSWRFPLFTQFRSMTTSQYFGSSHNCCVTIFNSAIEAVLPDRMIQKHVVFSEKDNLLTVAEKSFKVNKNVYIIGFGKAVCGMAAAVDVLLEKNIVKGILSIPFGMQQTLKNSGKSSLLPTSSQILLYEGAANNVPDENAHATALKIQELVCALQSSDILIVLISGGGSALLPTPCLPITLEDEIILTKLMSSHGATITQLNTIRQNIEHLKGGGLAHLAYPAQVISLILSDVIGDPLDKIASGPTVSQTSEPQDCLKIFDHLNISHKVPKSVFEVLHEKQLEYEKNRSNFERMNASKVFNFIIGSNSIAVERARMKAEELGYQSIVLSTYLEGEARDVGCHFVNLAISVCNQYINKFMVKKLNEYDFPEFSNSKLDELKMLIKSAASNSNPICILCGGETTVTMKGNGKGGRNQEMALSVAVMLQEIFTNDLKKEFIVEFLSAGTDGQDGPTDVAGAMVSSEMVVESSAKDFLNNNDSYNFFKSYLNGQHFVWTGLTATNVMDIQLLIIKRKK
ncbi:glycerate kinase [Octopus bimaculoides]|nr:glycerate kinase [Octopus bimaculoides]|eukprot:XP_014790499.1 PREDICTED: glycerate kinase-like [Octopus bimaculoides]